MPNSAFSVSSMGEVLAQLQVLGLMVNRKGSPPVSLPCLRLALRPMSEFPEPQILVT